MDFVEIEVKIIAHAGDSQSYSMESIAKAREYSFEEAESLLEKAKSASLEAHRAHTELISESAKKGNPSVGVLTVHASTHMSVAEVLVTMAELFIVTMKEVKGKC